LSEIAINNMRILRILLLAATGHITQAADITVNNQPGAVADFSSLSAALTAAESGDRLLIAGSATSYGAITIPKSGLTLVGIGYLRSANNMPADASGNNHSAKFSLSLGVGSSSISDLTVIGCEIASINLTGSHSNVLFDRCYVDGFIYLDQENLTRFTRCYLVNGLSISSSTNCSVVGSILGGLSLKDSAIASHCVIRSTAVLGWPVPSGGTVLGIDATCSASNLIVDSTSSSTNYAPSVFGSVTHSIGFGSIDLPSGAGNQEGLVKTSVVSATGSLDAAWVLTATSAAKGAASDATDIGAFGGSSPYVLSGVPGAPRITRLLVPAIASPTTGLSIEVDINQDTP
jgi:hypothetical protein